jgi:hypothetical protein
MGFAFNPFTGNFDLKGSGGGGGASYIDGEVAVYTDLPLDGTAALNTAWLVREASGAWLLARKPAGIYIRTATAGVSRDADYTYAGILPDVFSDANFLLYDNGDSSKNLAFQLSGITTGTTRTLTVPDANITIENTGHAAKHHTGGTDAIAPNNIGAESLFTASGFTVSGTTTTLSAGRAQIVTIIALSATTINLPTTGNQYGDRLVIRGGSPVLGTITLSATLVSDTITAEGQQRSYVWQSTGTGDRWVLNSVDIHTHAASDVTTGTFDNARINFAAPPAIGNTTPAAISGTTGTFSTLTANNGTLTASAPVLDLAQTWNDEAVFVGNTSGGTLTVTSVISGVIKVGQEFTAGDLIGAVITGLGTGTGGTGTYTIDVTNVRSGITFTSKTRFSAPAQISVTDVSSGEYSNVFSCLVNGSPRLRITKNGWMYLTAINNSVINRQVVGAGDFRIALQGTTEDSRTFTDVARFLTQGVQIFGSLLIGSSDLSLFRDAADTLAQRRTTNPQTFNIYNTFTSATNHERGFLKWSSNVFQIGTEKGSGGGTARALEFQTDGVTRMTLGSAGGVTLNSGNLVLTDNTGSETATFDAQGKLSANRTYDLPDASGTLVVATGAVTVEATSDTLLTFKLKGSDNVVRSVAFAIS